MGKKTTSTREGAARSRSTTNGNGHTNGNGNGHSNGNGTPRAAATTARRAAPSRAATPTAVAKAPAKAPARSRAPRAAQRQGATPTTPTPRNGRSIRIDTEQIAIRAYFIAERRRHEGHPCDPTQDWIIAEQELIAEIRRS